MKTKSTMKRKMKNSDPPNVLSNLKQGKEKIFEEQTTVEKKLMELNTQRELYLKQNLDLSNRLASCQKQNDALLKEKIEVEHENQKLKSKNENLRKENQIGHEKNMKLFNFLNNLKKEKEDLVKEKTEAEKELINLREYCYRPITNKKLVEDSQQRILNRYIEHANAFRSMPYSISSKHTLLKRKISIINQYKKNYKELLQKCKQNLIFTI